MLKHAAAAGGVNPEISMCCERNRNGKIIIAPKMSNFSDLPRHFCFVASPIKFCAVPVRDSYDCAPCSVHSTSLCAAQG